jgi:hypothetical protein
MKKKSLFFIVFFVFVFFGCVNVYALGLTPAKVIVNFQPDSEFDVKFTVLGSGKPLKVYADGPFKEYVSFDKENVTGGQSFTANVYLPTETKNYGDNRLYIRVEEIPEATQGIGTKLSVGALILIKVPYPGQYAEIFRYNVNDVNVGEPVNISIIVVNLGQENIAANAKTTIKNSRNETVEVIDLGNRFIDTTNQEIFTYLLDTSSYRPGTYNTTAIVDYGQELLKEEKGFRIGTLFVNITNYTRKVEQGKISKFMIRIKSKWNDDIENVYATVNVTKGGNSTDFFKTPSISLNAWNEAELFGFLNAENVKAGIYGINISLFYNGEVTSKIAEVEITKDFNYLYLIIPGAVFLLIVVIVVIFLIKRKNGKKK